MKMTLWTAVGGILLLVSSGDAFAKEPVDLPLILHPGDRLQLEYSHQRNNNGRTAIGNIVAEIAIGDVRDDDFNATWTTSSVEVGGTRIDTGSPQASAFLLGVPIEYVADSDGSPIRIQDKAQLLDTLLASPLFSSGNAQTAASVRSLFDSMSEQALAQLFLKVPAYIALCQGTSLPLGERNEAMVQMPSPLGGGTVNAEVSYLLEAIDAQRGKANIKYRLTLDPESAKKLVTQMLDQIDNAKKPSQSEIAELSIERNDFASCEVSADNGLAESVRFTTENTIPNQTKSETYVISISYDPVRTN